MNSEKAVKEHPGKASSSVRKIKESLQEVRNVILSRFLRQANALQREGRINQNERVNRWTIANNQLGTFRLNI